MRASRVTLFVLASVLGLAACSSDKSTSKGQGSNDGDGGVQDSSTGPELNDSGTCLDTTKVFDGQHCIDKAAGVSLCKDRVTQLSPTSKTDDPACGAGCTCQQCTQQMLDINTDPDGYAAQILQCAQDHNCLGVGCYSMATCQTVIDNAPNGGLSSYSVALTIALSDCATAAKCSAACP